MSTPTTHRHRIDFRQLRLAHGFTRPDVYRALNVDRKVVHQWDTGSRQPSTPFLPGIARMFGVSIEELYVRPATEAQATTP
ncbi:helix-turn-helix transcriptional regulator [Microbispora siamensis]|uniref:helix-turn-helix transcriptional regulator n=1 Tax=Microbispora siamensis TaxID=564413 RepID=UPI001951B3B0|nr:helix-turn-helix transcriptional regulator [Microbispora siamensis]